MSASWLAVAVIGLGTVLLKSTGPVLLGGKEPPAALTRIVGLLAPALLAALVVTQAFGEERALVLDARAAGLGAAAAAVALRAPLLAVIVVAAAATALVRAI